MSRQQGITLVELIVTIIVLGIALTGISLAIQLGVGRSSDTLLELRTVALAQAYLDEILGKRFDENTNNRGVPPCRPAGDACTLEGAFGPDGGETRATFDDVDDYHGMDEGDDQTNALQDSEGNERQGYENFRVQVNVRYINLGGGEEEETLAQGDELNDEGDAKLITVTVRHRGLSQGYDFSAYKANF
ncbi:MAG: type II secretion system protein [Pseudohongiellaceae bacterium]